MLIVPADKCPALACITLRNGTLIITILWDLAQCIKPTCECTALHEKIFAFHCDIVDDVTPLSVK
eukprot:5289686-Ditylum_brightwellii.AAC.1